METLLLPAVTLSASLALFVALYKLVRFETLRGERVVLRRVRGFVDWTIDSLGMGFRTVVTSVWRSLYRAKQQTTDHNLTNVLVRHATNTPLTVTHTDNHLSKMRDHKSAVALTPAQGRKLRQKKLEERF